MCKQVIAYIKFVSFTEDSCIVMDAFFIYFVFMFEEEGAVTGFQPGWGQDFLGTKNSGHRNKKLRYRNKNVSPPPEQIGHIKYNMLGTSWGCYFYIIHTGNNNRNIN